jgi:acetyl esterase/lipase
LRDSGERYAARLEEAGVDVERWRAPGLPHGGLALTAVNPTAREWQDRLCASMTRHLHRPESQEPK